MIQIDEKDLGLEYFVEKYCRKFNISKREFAIRALRALLEDDGHTLPERVEANPGNHADLDEVARKIQEVLRIHGTMPVSKLRSFVPHSYQVISKAIRANTGLFVVEKAYGRPGNMIRLPEKKYERPVKKGAKRKKKRSKRKKAEE